MGSVITFFQKGAEKRFYISGNSNKEMSFLDVVKVFSSFPDCEKEKLPENFFDLVGRNKKAFVDDFYGQEEAMFEDKNVRKNSNRSVALEKLAMIQKAGFLEEDVYNKNYIKGLKVFLERGRENDQVLKQFKSSCENVSDVRVYLEKFQELIPKTQIDRVLKKQKEREDKPSEVILSEAIVTL